MRHSKPVRLETAPTGLEGNAVRGEYEPTGLEGNAVRGEYEPTGLEGNVVRGEYEPTGQLETAPTKWENGLKRCSWKQHLPYMRDDSVYLFLEFTIIAKGKIHG